MEKKDKWMVLTDISQIKKNSIYQEKVVVMVGREVDIEGLKSEVLKRGGELTTLPPRAEKMVLEHRINAFAYWGNKHNPYANVQDIAEGSLRIKINDDEI